MSPDEWDVIRFDLSVAQIPWIKSPIKENFTHDNEYLNYLQGPMQLKYLMEFRCFNTKDITGELIFPPTINMKS